ncbi:P2RX7 protein, partial [Alcedo cyanopectus]|nr:P2RX7 protein [Ceyx cyanopectus]
YVVFIYRLYQETDEVNSSVRTSLKGVAYSNNRTWDVAEYTLPTMATNSFFVVTNLIRTENQVERECPEYPFNKSVCSSDEFCEKGRVDVHSNGIQTGRCVNYNATVKTCEVHAWCPVESTENPPEPAVLRSSENFTVLIKNNIHFPKFEVTVLNVPSTLDTSCMYNKETSPLCPIFRLGDILQEAKENFSKMAIKGGIISIEINWDCDLDSWFYSCNPKYVFRRLDHRKITPGFYFRDAKYHRLPNGEEQRTLFKVFGIRFDVLVFGTGRRFNGIALIKNLGSMISYFGLVAVIIEIVISVGSWYSGSKSAFYKVYNRKKYDTVLNPSQVMYVSFVDEPHVTWIKKPLKTSLQHAKGHIVESHPVKCCAAGSCCYTESNENHSNEESKPTHTNESNRSRDNEEAELKQPLTQEASSSVRPEWCCCGECRPTQEHQEQLCCRRKEGRCITTSLCFQQLVLSRHSLERALLYTDPFADLSGDGVATRLRHLAHQRYLHWRFGSLDPEDRAIIPSCCRWKIKDTYSKAVNKCTDVKKE